jgi:hypothetical protein
MTAPASRFLPYFSATAWQPIGVPLDPSRQLGAFFPVDTGQCSVVFSGVASQRRCASIEM